MDNRELAHKFVFIMSDLPTKDLKELADTLDSPSEAHKYADLIRHEIELRKSLILKDMKEKLHSDNLSNSIDVETEYNDYIKIYSLSKRHTKSIDLVAHLLTDKNLFKNNKDVENVIKRIFKIDPEYNGNERDELIKNCMDKIYKIQDEEQQQYFKLFVNELAKSLDYRKLFKILSRKYD